MTYFSFGELQWLLCCTGHIYGLCSGVLNEGHTAVGDRKELCSRPEFYDEQIPDTVDLAKFIHKEYNPFRSSDKS